MSNMGWNDIADDPFYLVHTLKEQSLPLRMPQTLTLRLLFTEFLDINAVPRRSFFSLLRHMTTDPLETEKLDEFLTGPEGAVSIYNFVYAVLYQRHVPSVASNRTTCTTTVIASGVRSERF